MLLRECIGSEQSGVGGSDCFGVTGFRTNTSAAELEKGRQIEKRETKDSWV